MNVNRCRIDTNHIPYLWRPFKFFFQQLHWFLQLQSCFIKWYQKERSVVLRIHNGSCFETLNLRRSSSCKIFTFCDVLHERKQNTHKLESGQYGLEIIFKLQKANISILSYCEVNTLCCRHRSHWRWSTWLSCAGSLAWHLNEKIVPYGF